MSGFVFGQRLLMHNDDVTDKGTFFPAHDVAVRFVAYTEYEWGSGAQVVPDEDKPRVVWGIPLAKLRPA